MKHLFTAALVLTSTLHCFAQNVADSVIRVSTTQQHYNPSQPWDKTSPQKRHALAAVLPNNQVLTTAEMVANANFIQLELASGEAQTPAKIIAVDYEANLALLAPSTDAGKDILANLHGLEIASHTHLGNTVQIIQIEDNGMPIITEGRLQSANVFANFVPGHYFLTYEVKASMQSAANSFTVPVLEDGKLLGLLASYSSSDQIVDVISPEVIHSFLEDAKDGDYAGFPNLGIATARTTDTNFRDWLKLPANKGGLYITQVQPKSSAANAGIKPGDVLTTIDNHAIDRRGYYQTDDYGQLFWSHLIRGTKPIGSKVPVTVLRDGKELKLEVTLSRVPSGIIPSHTYGKAPRYLVKGGLIFQELTESYLQAYGDNWETRAPLNLLDALNHPEDYSEGRKRLVFLSAAIPTPATLGYESLASAIVEEVNGQKIEDIPSLIAAFKKAPANGIHSIKLDDQPETIFLDSKTSDAVDQQLLQRGLPSLSRDTE